METKKYKKPQNAARKKAMIQALEKTLGIVTQAAKIAGIDRETHARWMRSDPAYKEAVDSVSDIALDFAESCLHKRIKDGSDAATIFFLKTKGRKRGYVEGESSESKKTNIAITVSSEDVKNAIDLL